VLFDVLQEMKPVLIVFTILISTVFAQQDWVDLPDGYTWEEPPVNQPQFTPSTITTNLLSTPLTEAILEQWPDDKLPARLEISEVDLNGDDRREIFVGIPEYSGTGGTAFMILSPTDKGLRYVGSVFGFGFEFLAPMNGWMKIKGYSRGGGGHHTRYLYQFGDSGYEDVRIENHNMIERTVRIRDPRAEKAGTGQPATRPESKSEGGDKPQPEAEGRSR
jgi:hypothetical protein